VLSTTALRLNQTDPPFRFTTYQWSPDEKQILFISAPPEREYLSRLTPAGNIFLYDLSSKSFRRLTNVADPQYNVKFSPDGKFVGFVRNNNIYALDIASGAEHQLTEDGAEHIINGKFDWVYEEEFEISDGWQWSPDSKHIAFWRLDENRVPEYTLTEWDSLHLQLIPMRYPKAGEPNSIVKIGVVDFQSSLTQWMDIGTNDDIYIPRIQWTLDPTVLSIQRMNRGQNILELLYADISTGATRTVLKETDDKWIDVTNDLTFLKNGSFIWPSERDGYRHLYLYKNDGTLLNQITKGKWEVESFYGVDEKTDDVYYSSTEVSPLERQIYKIQLDGKNKHRLTTILGTHTANFSPSCQYFLDTYSNISTPPKIALLNSDGNILSVIEENSISALDDIQLGKTTFLSFTTADGVQLNASIMKPADFDSTKKYPVLVYTYGGPGSQVVLNMWERTSDVLWYTYLGQHGYLIFMVDNRGTGARGKEFKTAVYRNLGKWEVNDQVEGAKYLSSLQYVDKDRIGIWGWSYGAYLTSMVILNGADYFKAAIAVAPVTSWRYYDNIYTERYMGTPQNNPAGYVESSPITHASKLKGKFLLIHGTSDDNVHFQNTANFVSALEKANKQFSTMFYPDKNHGIYGGVTRLNLYTLMTNFILTNL
jgi:dipeptidyl-peptidase-4